jgi:hypothetical protein
MSGSCRIAAMLTIAALGLVACGDDDSEDAVDDVTTTTAAVETSAPEPDGDADVDEAFCTALSADLDAIDAIVDSFESTGAAPDTLVQDAQEANDALRDATPDGLTDESSAIHEPLRELLDDLESGDANIAEDYAAVVGSSSFTGPLGTLTQRCATASTSG